MQLPLAPLVSLQGLDEARNFPRDRSIPAGGTVTPSVMTWWRGKSRRNGALPAGVAERLGAGDVIADNDYLPLIYIDG